MKAATILATALVAANALSAQIGEDPREKIREQLAQIEKGMKEVDTKLRETGSTRDAATEMKRNVKRIEELLKNVGSRQQKVVSDIDELIKQLMEQARRQQQQQQQQQQRQQQQQQQQQDQQRQRQRRRMRDPGRPPPQNQQQPEDRQVQNQRPENQRAKVMPKRPTGKADHKNTKAPWGDLPPYIMRHRRGTTPEVPEKYRKYLEALMKQKPK